jgi:nucleoside-diphosphate-sugar epimerase
MTTSAPVAAVTGASGYLGSRICTTLESRGWRVIRLSRSPDTSHRRTCVYDLSAPVSSEVRAVLDSADLLVHAAYDLALTSTADIWRVNVEGTRRLLAAAAEAQVRRVLVLSSMSAFEGTTQIFGRAKLDIEAMTVASHGCAVRPGVVYGEDAGGMAAALQKITRLPIVPVVAGGTGLYTVREDELMAAVAALAEARDLAPQTLSVAHPTPVVLPDLLTAFAAQEGRRCRFVPVPWQLVYGLLRTAELLRLRLPFRADSLLALVRTAPCVMNGEPVAELGVTLHAFTLHAADRANGDH